MYRQQIEDPDAITAYPRLRAGSVGHAPVFRQQSFPLQSTQATRQQQPRQVNSLERTQHHYRYMSDPALLDDDREVSPHQYSTDSGRRSAMSVEDYSRSEESENLERHVRKVKKKKMRHLRSFMSAFIGGLKHRENGEENKKEKEDIAFTRHRQRDERNGLARAVAGGSSASSRGADERGGDVSSRRRNSFQGGGAPSPRHQQLQRPPGLVLPSQLQHGGSLQLRGLHNHGNTCFMNAVLQCLSNTDRLAEYFVTDAYKGDFNKNGSKLTTSSNITEQFALLLKCLWSGQYNPVVSSRFKGVVGRAAEQYQGTAQHDAQEFFLWLLDNIHEDLNQAATRRYKPLKVSWVFSLQKILREGNYCIRTSEKKRIILFCRAHCSQTARFIPLKSLPVYSTWCYELLLAVRGGGSACIILSQLGLLNTALYCFNIALCTDCVS